MILDKVNSPSDVKMLNKDELNTLADEIRKVLINKVEITGGHMGSNLGFIEPTIALHYVFSTPKDKIIYDVSHQCYTHKILTGRKDNFLDESKFDDISGYTNPNESIHDFFQIGHTSTSISLACGMAIARDLKKEDGNVIAVIGDGSLTGGEAFEGLNNASVLKSNIIIVVNDNEMSIAENKGGMVGALKTLRESDGTCNNNFFKALGFDYYYVKDGNDVKALIDVFKKVKDVNHPVVIHVHTLKGKGYLPALENKERGHWLMPKDFKFKNEETYEEIFKNFIYEKASNDESIIGITAATPGVVGFTKEFREKVKKHYLDVGIAEQHAVTLSSAIAKAGAKPYFGVHSSFIQRAYDQLSQCLALNNNPAVIVVFSAGLSSMDATHVGAFDIPLISNIPNLVYLAPTCKEEFVSMLEYSYAEKEHPIVIRVPQDDVLVKKVEDKTDYGKLNKFKVEHKGNTVAVLAVGDFYRLGMSLKDALKEELNIDATFINPIYLTGLDLELLEKLKDNHSIIVTLENGVLDGGFGEKIARYYGNSTMKVLNYGGKKEFTDRKSLNDIYEENHLTTSKMIEDIKKLI
mgnify:FL=1